MPSAGVIWKFHEIYRTFLYNSVLIFLFYAVFRIQLIRQAELSILVLRYSVPIKAFLFSAAELPSAGTQRCALPRYQTQDLKTLNTSSSGNRTQNLSSVRQHACAPAPRLACIILFLQQNLTFKVTFTNNTFDTTNLEVSLKPVLEKRAEVDNNYKLEVIINFYVKIAELL